MEWKFACGVVLYNPSQENMRHIKDIKKLFDLLIVFDNTPGLVEQKDFDIYFSTGKNEGLAIPYNRFINYCKVNHIDVLCLLDQDTMILADDIKRIKEYIISNKNEEVIVYAPRLKGTKEKDWVINSNSFIKVEECCKNNLYYDTNYFLDRLDADFCMQIKRKSLRIEIIEDVEVAHNIGEGIRKEHSCIRHYYIFRNRLYFNKKYYRCIKRYALDLFQSIKHVICICRENDTLLKMRYCRKALSDHLNNCYGRK